MDRNKILSEIESRMKQIETEYQALAEAHLVVSKTYQKKPIKPLNLKSLVKLAGQTSKNAKPAKKASKTTKSPGKRHRSSNGFSKNVVAFFKGAGKFQATAAIATKFKSSYPNKSEVELTRYIAVVLSQLKSKGLLASYSPENKGQTGRLLMWGLPEWMDGQKPKSSFVKK
jgi:hypothetical protein